MISEIDKHREMAIIKIISRKEQSVSNRMG